MLRLCLLAASLAACQAPNPTASPEVPSSSKSVNEYDLSRLAVGHHLSFEELPEGLYYYDSHALMTRGLVELGIRAFSLAVSSDSVVVRGSGLGIGQGGRLEISGTTWSFVDYTPWLGFSGRNATPRINGTLFVGENQVPHVPVQGTLEVLFPETTVRLDLVVELTPEGLVPSGVVFLETGWRTDIYETPSGMDLVEVERRIHRILEGRRSYQEPRTGCRTGMVSY